MANEDAPTPPASVESVLWKGHTSQWVHFWFYLFCLILLGGIGFGATLLAVPTAGLSYLALLLPLIMWIIRWWVTKTTEYELTTQRFKIRSGVLNRRLDELELFRVRDYAMNQPLLLRMLGLGNLTITTSDATTPTIAMRAIPNVEQVRELLRNAVQSERDRRRVRALDLVDGAGEGSDSVIE